MNNEQGQETPGQRIANDFYELLHRNYGACPPEHGDTLAEAIDLYHATEFTTLQQEITSLKGAKDGAYAERNKCVVGLALLARDLGFKVGLARHPEEDTEWEDDWRNIVVIELPTGQLTWHFHDSEMHMLYSFCRLEGHEWDGHTTEEKYRRLLDYTPTVKDSLIVEIESLKGQVGAYRDHIAGHYCRPDSDITGCNDCDILNDDETALQYSQDQQRIGAEREAKLLADEILKALETFWIRKTEHPGHSETYYSESSNGLPYSLLMAALRESDKRLNPLSTALSPTKENINQEGGEA